VLNSSKTYYKEMFHEWNFVPLCAAPDANVESLIGLSSTSSESDLAKGIQESIGQFETCVLDSGDDPFTGTYKIASLSLTAKFIKFLGWIGFKKVGGGKNIFKLEFWKSGKKVIVETPPMAANSQPAEILQAAMKKAAGAVNWSEVKTILNSDFGKAANYLNGRRMKLMIDGQEVRFILTVNKDPRAFSLLDVGCNGNCEKVANLFAKSFGGRNLTVEELSGKKMYRAAGLRINRFKNSNGGVHSESISVSSEAYSPAFIEQLISKGMTIGN
jgi:hypothetical protein